MFRLLHYHHISNLKGEEKREEKGKRMQREKGEGKEGEGVVEKGEGRGRGGTPTIMVNGQRVGSTTQSIIAAVESYRLDQ